MNAWSPVWLGDSSCYNLSYTQTHTHTQDLVFSGMGAECGDNISLLIVHLPVGAVGPMFFPALDLGQP